MKKFFLFAVLAVLAVAARSQTASFTLTTTPCHDDGVLTANTTGLTPPLTFTWTTMGFLGATYVHSGIMTTSDALTSYSGGPIQLMVTDGTSTVYNSYSHPPFTYTVSTTMGSCLTLGTATASPSGGTAPYTYQWYSTPSLTAVGTSNPISLPAGSYAVKITDAAGCTYGSLVDPDSVYINDSPSFYVPVTTTTASCTNGTATVGTITGGTGPFSYLWSTGATSSSITGLVEGSYTVSVTDAMGCTGTGYGYVNQTPVISVPTTPTPATCLSSDGAVIAFGSGGVPPYTYLWSNGATTQSQTGLTSGSYNVTVTDVNGCIGHGYAYISASTPITVTYSASPSLCTSATGSATLSVSGGTLPYTINWYTTPPQTGVTATALPAGSYGFHITDAVGCVQTGSAVVPPIDVMSAYFTSTDATCALSNGSLIVTPSGGVLPYTYLWNTGATTSGISSVPTGGYSVRITDANGCAINKSGYVPDYSPLGVALSSVPASCIFTADGSVSAVAYGGTLPYTYSWSSGGTTSTVSSLHTGPYWVYITDAAGCTAWDYDYVGYNPSTTSCYCTISGTVYYDINGNCVQDPGEPGIPNIQIYCSGIGYTYTDLSGNYSFIVPSGSYTITQTVLAFYPLSACQPNNIPVTVVASTGCVHTVDFADNINPIHDMHITTWDYFLPVPGHTYAQVAVVSNDGTLTESSILASYRPDGQIFAPSFVPGGVFSGSPYWYTSGTFPTLNPGHAQTFLMNYAVPTSIPLGTTLVFKDSVAYTAPMSNWLSDYSPWNNVNYFTSYTVGSFDPNFKEVSPKGVGPTGIISGATDTVLQYMVHFQNTGTYMAENVVVLDTLDSHLDWTSLRPVYESGKCQIELTQSGSYHIAKFTFKDIDLPTSASEPVTSNGMFTYSIKLLHGLAVGTQIKNNASIYFDYNAPVKTNTTLNTIGTNTEVPPVPVTEANSFTVYPNPAGNTFNAVISTTDAVTANMNVVDVTGKTLISKTLSLQRGTQNVPADVSLLSPGVYFVTLDINGKTQTQKLVIMK